MSGSLPDTLPFLTVLDSVDIVQGSTILGSSISGGAHTIIGAGVEHSSLWLHHTLSGRFPLHFSGHSAPDRRSTGNPQDDEDEDSIGSKDGYDGPSLQVQVTPSPRHNVISLPDVSGTVITTGNTEALCDLPHTPVYRLQSRHVLLTAFQIAAFGAQSSQLLQRQSEPKEASCSKKQSRYPGYATPHATPRVGEERAEGIFAFLDSSQSALKELPKLDANSFFVRAYGGVRLTTGIVQRSCGREPLEIGVQIPPKGSGWSILSDRNAKANISQVDDLWMLNTIVKIPVSTWQYSGAPEGMGELGTSVRHMGPMAQDWNTALAPLNLGHRAENGSVPDERHSRILTSDTDGVLMSAARGITREINSQQAVIGELEVEVEMLMMKLQANNARILRNAASISRNELILSSLELRDFAML